MKILDLKAEQNPHLSEIKTEGKLAYQGSFLQVQKDTVKLPNDHLTTREYIKHPGAVVILPLLDNGNILLERQYRYPLNQVFIELPAGKIDPGEDSLVCAKRELREETGYTANEWQFLCTIHNAIAYSDEHLDIYLAKGLVVGEAQLDQGEFLEVFDAPLDDVLSWIKAGNITDVKTMIGVFWLDKIIQKTW
jgi:ADP-ribose pyrophosphatase